MSRLSNSLPTAVTYSEMTHAGNELPGWLWRGFIAFGSISLLTSRWKCGKTTLLSVLLARMRTGGMLAGSETVAAAAIVVSEETTSLWVDRGRKTPFGDNVRWLCRPFVGKPNRDQWFGLIEHLANLAGGVPTLIVVDPLAMALPGHDENNAGTIVDALSPLQKLSSAGHAILLLHHPRKGRSLEPRGSGAITSLADILIQMDVPANEADHPNRRWLRGRGRIDGVVFERLIELNAEHTNYAVIDPTAEEMSDGWPVIEWVLSDANQKYTRKDVRDSWPEMRDKPHPASLWKWLESAVSDARLKRDGEGRPHKPFRYWLPTRERYFLPDLPPLEPLAYAHDFSEEEIEYAKQVVKRGKR